MSDRQHTYVYRPPAGAPAVLYEDGDILIAGKPAGLLTVPGKRSSDSLTERLRAGRPYVVPAHRLDEATSGIVLFARNREAAARLCASFRDGRAAKLYVARAEGVVAADRGALDYPLSRDLPASALRGAPVQRVDYAGGKKALTLFRVVERDRAGGNTVVVLEPRTGRTHQIRVHLREFGHPVRGDALYGTPGTGRLELHAFFLSFPHPRTGAPVRAFAPADFLGDGEIRLQLYLPEAGHEADDDRQHFEPAGNHVETEDDLLPV